MRVIAFFIAVLVREGNLTLMKETKTKVYRKPTSGEAYLCVGLAAIIILGALIFKMRVEFALLVVAAIAAVISLRLGYSWDEMEKAIGHRIGTLTPTILIMWAIGFMLGAMLFSGTLPMIVYYGFELINPKFLYLSAFLVCCVMSVLTGSSWTSAGTAGIACMALAQGMGANTGIMAGAIISGAVFGDKISPMSETTNLAPACAGTELWLHVKSQLWTTIPAFIIGCILYTFLGFGLDIGGAGLPENAVIIMKQLSELYHWNIILLLPLLVMLILVMTKKPVVPSLLICGAISIILGIVIQGFSLSTGTIAAIKGFTAASIAPEGYEIDSTVSYLLNRGGMMSMASIVLICYCGFSATTIMIHAGILDKAVEPLMRNLNSRIKTVATAEVAIFVIHAIAGNSYVSSVFVGEAWEEAYIKNGMGRQTLSRTLEDVGTCVSCMFPWGNSGAFYATTLGVAAYGAGGYIPYTVMWWACPLFALIWAITGIGINKLTDEQIKEELAAIEAAKKDEDVKSIAEI